MAKQNLLALFAFAISVLALVLSYRKFRHDTNPALILRRGGDGFEVENVGPAVAVGITVQLIERVKRPSAKLSVSSTLRRDEKASISAFDWPKSLEGKLATAPSSFEESVRRSAGEEIHYSGAKVASYVLAREGKQIVFLRFRVGDKRKTFVRLFVPLIQEERFTELVPSHGIFRNRICVLLLKRWYAGNAEFRPPFKFPPLE